MTGPSEPTVSVLVPAFNAEAYVGEALESVCSQTIDDWEIVAVDDGSRDGTWHLLKEWARRDGRIRALANDVNLGMTPNWNRCLSEARGALVLKLDADDVLRPQTLETLSASLHDPGVGAAAVRALLCTAEGEPFGALPADAAVADAGIDPYADHDLPGARWMEIAAFGHQLWASSAVMTSRNWLLATGGWDERFGCASDTDLILRLLRTGRTCSHHGYVGLHYRVLPGSVSDTFRRHGWLRWEAVAVFLRNLQSCPELLQSSRRARQRQVVLWNQWEGRLKEESWTRQVPEALRSKLEDAMRGIQAPPRRDRAAEALVAAVRRLTS